jgi:nucleoside-diphosphate-sugar epimerase
MNDPRQHPGADPANSTSNADPVFVAGATGVVGRVLCRLLRGEGRRVVGTTRSPERARELAALGVEPVVVDVFDAQALTRALRDARPAAVVHQLTDLPDHLEPADRPAALERNARIREAGTRHLVEACVAARVGRLVCQSIAFAYAPGAAPHAEDDALNVDAADPIAARTARAVQTMEQLVLGGPFDGIVLRYGRFYGPGTWSDAPAASCAVHVDAAADAARLALRRGTPGVYNVAEPDASVSVAKALAQLGWDPAFRAR